MVYPSTINHQHLPINHRIKSLVFMLSFSGDPHKGCPSEVSPLQTAAPAVAHRVGEIYG